MKSSPRIRVWTAPIVLGVIAAIGLIAALLSDGIGDYLAWLSLSIPVAVVLWYAPPRRKQNRDERSIVGSSILDGYRGD